MKHVWRVFCLYSRIDSRKEAEDFQRSFSWLIDDKRTLQMKVNRFKVSFQQVLSKIPKFLKGL